MKFLTLFLIFLSLNSLAQTEAVPNWIVGSWKLTGYIYHDEFKPPLNPNLVVLFKYQNDGTDFLSWHRVGETGFCQRRGQFSVDSGNLIEKVEWINPKNAIDCAQDPDMQIGKQTSTPIELVDGKLQLNIGLSGEDFYYIFETVTE